MSSFPFLPGTISLVDRHSGIYQGTGRCRCSHSTGAITADTVQIERSGCSGTSADSEHLHSITHRPYPTPATLTLSYFNPRPPLRGATLLHSRFNLLLPISIHAPLAGSDCRAWRILVSRPLISIHAPLAGSDLALINGETEDDISIHAPLAGSDYIPPSHSFQPLYFNPRSPCGERHPPDCSGAQQTPHFNPRSPCGERLGSVKTTRRILTISIHAPLAGSDAVEVRVGAGLGISIHAPLAGSDLLPRRSWLSVLLFQSTLPLRGATCRIKNTFLCLRISIHAPLAGSDTVQGDSATPDRAFQSTLPLRGATRLLQNALHPAQISIHAPLAGSDSAHP